MGILVDIKPLSQSYAHSRRSGESAPPNDDRLKMHLAKLGFVRCAIGRLTAPLSMINLTLADRTMDVSSGCITLISSPYGHNSLRDLLLVNSNYFGGRTL